MEFAIFSPKKMLNRTILLLIVVISWCSYDLVRSQIILGVDIEDLNITRALSQSYEIGGSRVNDNKACASVLIEQQPGRGTVLTLEATMALGTVDRCQTFGHKPEFSRSECKPNKETRAGFCRNTYGPYLKIEVSGVSYNVYRTANQTYGVEEMGVFPNGTILINGVEPKLVDVPETKVEPTNSFSQRVKSYPQLITPKANGCL